MLLASPILPTLLDIFTTLDRQSGLLPAFRSGLKDCIIEFDSLLFR